MIAPGTKAILSLTNTSPTISGFKIKVWIVTFFAYMTYHLSRKPISVAKSVLHCDNTTDDHNDSSTCHSWPPFDGPNYKTLLASLDYVYLFAYAFGMFASGHIAERTNIRYFLTIGMVGSGLFTALFGFGRYWQIHNIAYYIVMQIVAGLFQSTGWPSVVTAVANWFGKGRRGLIMGVWNAHTSLGNILGGLIGGAFVDDNWGLTFIVPGAIIAGMGVLVFFFLVPYPEEVGLHIGEPMTLPVNANDNDTSDENSEKGLVNREGEQTPLMGESTPDQPPTGHQAISIRRALAIPGVIEFSMCLFFAKLVSYTFLFWLPFYIRNVDKYSGSKSADLATVFDVGGIIGSIVAGLVSDKTRSPGSVCTVSFILAAPALFVYQHVHIPGETFAFSIVMLLICGAFVNGPYGLITTAVSADLGTHESLRGSARALSTVTAIIDGTGSMGAALGPLLTGIITSSSKSGWQYVFYMLIAADVLAMCCMSRIVFKEVPRWRQDGFQH